MWSSCHRAGHWDHGDSSWRKVAFSTPPIHIFRQRCCVCIIALWCDQPEFWLYLRGTGGHNKTYHEHHAYAPTAVDAADIVLSVVMGLTKASAQPKFRIHLWRPTKANDQHCTRNTFSDQPSTESTADYDSVAGSAVIRRLERQRRRHVIDASERIMNHQQGRTMWNIPRLILGAIKRS